MEDIRKVDGPGVDTQEERDQLNYKPQIEYTKPLIDSSYYTTPSILNLDNLDPAIRPLVVPKVADVWTGAIEILNTLQEFEDELSERLKNTYAVVPDRYQSIIKDAAENLGYDIPEGKIPFGLYKDALLSPDSSDKIIIIDVFEDYQSDVEGELIAEIYPDVVEMQEDWKDITEFIKGGLLLQFVDSKNVPTDILAGNENIAVIDQKEKELIEKFLSTYNLSKNTQHRLGKLKVLSYESTEYFDTYGKYSSITDQLRDLKRRVYTKNEVASLVESKIENVKPLVSSLIGYSDHDPYKGALFNTLYGLVSQYNSGQNAAQGLRKVQALIKLSIDGKIEESNSTKANLRGLVSNKHKKNANKSLVKGSHLRNEIFGEVHDALDAIVSPPNDPVFNIVAGHIVDSMTQAEALYTEQTSDFYKIHTLDTTLREEKLGQLVNKDGARRFYQILGKLISYTGSTNWPNATRLPSWLNDFIDQEGLSE